MLYETHCTLPAKCFGSHQNTEYKIHLKIIFLDEHDTHLGRKKNMGSTLRFICGHDLRYFAFRCNTFEHIPHTPHLFTFL